MLIGNEAVHANDIGVIHIGRQLCFTQEAVSGFGVRIVFGLQDLHGDRFADHGIFRAVDVTHSTAQVFFNDVLPNALGMWR